MRDSLPSVGKGPATRVANDAWTIDEDEFDARIIEAGRRATLDPTWRRVRRAAFAAYAAALLVIVAEFGVPTGRASLAVIIVTGLALTRLGQGWHSLRRVIRDWLPFSLVLLAYDRTRSLADGLALGLHEQDVLAAEKWLFGGVEPTVWLQHHLYDPLHVRWYDALSTIVYTSHFLATPVLAAVLWLRDRRLWVRHISRVIVLSVAGLVTYVVFPEAPPWYAARDGLSDPVSRLSARGWELLHLGGVNSLLKHAQEDGTNPVAAMPSLHVAFATLVAIIIATRLRSRWRYLLALYPLAMGFALVYTGEHYVLDLVAGVTYALAVHWLMNRWEQRSQPAVAAPVEWVRDVGDRLLAGRQ
jgi:membrane-associated phospholipid phosphatase